MPSRRYDTSEQHTPTTDEFDVGEAPFVPPWILKYTNSSIEELQQQVIEKSEKTRENSWDQGDMIAAAVLANLQAGGKATTIYNAGWGQLERSWVIMLANIARCWPPEQRDFARHISWYGQVLSVAKYDLGLTKVTNPTDWARLAQHCQQLSASPAIAAKTVEELSQMTASHPSNPNAGMSSTIGTAQPIILPGGETMYQMLVHVDLRGHLHVINGDGSVGRKLTMPEIVRAIGLLGKHVTITLTEGDHRTVGGLIGAGGVAAGPVAGSSIDPFANPVTGPTQLDIETAIDTPETVDAKLSKALDIARQVHDDLWKGVEELNNESAGA